jgi:prepilin-type N-terminal cleavage/methylation domain-containing protein
MRRSAPYRNHSPGGYTLVELVVVMAVASVLAAYIAPRLWNQQVFNDRGYADELAAALRSTQKAAVITDCPAALTLSPGGYAAAQQATLNNSCNPADTSWSTPVLSADGSSVQDTAPTQSSAGPTGTFQFDGQGRLTASPGTSITVGTHTITIDPGSGLVQVN